MKLKSKYRSAIKLSFVHSNDIRREEDPSETYLLKDTKKIQVTSYGARVPETHDQKNIILSFEYQDKGWFILPRNENGDNTNTVYMDEEKLKSPTQLVDFHQIYWMHEGQKHECKAVIL